MFKKGDRVVYESKDRRFTAHDGAEGTYVGQYHGVPGASTVKWDMGGPPRDVWDKNIRHSGPEPIENWRL